MRKFASHLKSWRKKRGLTQVQAAKRCKITQGEWSAYERGLVEPRETTRARIDRVCQ